jgi:hypothetical protein
MGVSLQPGTSCRDEGQCVRTGLAPEKSDPALSLSSSPCAMPLRQAAATRRAIMGRREISGCQTRVRCACRRSSVTRVEFALRVQQSAMLHRSCFAQEKSRNMSGFLLGRLGAQALKKLFNLSAQPSPLGECLPPPFLSESSSSRNSLRWCSVSFTGVSTVM